MDESQLQDAARRLHATLSPGNLDATLARITAAAVMLVPDVTSASISVKHADDSLETVAPTDDLLCEIDAAQYELREGPCYEAAAGSVHVISPDLAADPRFRRYAEVPLRHGIRAQAGIRLFEAPSSDGALNLYSPRVGAFDDLGVLADLFAHHAATAIAYAREITQLQEAVRTRQQIGQAVGVVMERYGVNDQRAFALLTRLSQDQNIKLRAIADRIVATGVVDSGGLPGA